ncbi:MAG: T9SS type A sorting domain-containing protein [Chitinophagales bacterium]
MVTATANDGSGVSGTKDITISNQGTAIKDIAFKGLSLYPNPTNDVVNLKVDEKLTSLLLYDLTGKTVKTFSANNTQLNVSDIQQGIYFLELKNEEKRSVVKLIID